jgi:hypothetical protein
MVLAVFSCLSLPSLLRTTGFSRCLTHVPPLHITSHRQLTAYVIPVNLG